ncbi:MAG: glycosyltransferase [Atribacterota bacterium]
MLEQQRVTVIVPAYNEAPRISPVLKVITSTSFVDDVLVIDDGSGDDTSRVASSFSVEVMRHSQNRGKGAALVDAIRKKSDGDIYLFIDADLIELNEKHLRSLAEPIALTSLVDMTSGVVKGGRGSSDLAQRLCPILNGQRAVRGGWIKDCPDFSWSRFGVEVFLTRYASDFGARIEMVPLWGISHFHKEEKYGPFLGVYHRFKMYFEVLYAYLFYENKMKMKEKIISQKPAEEDEVCAQVRR